jgi:hypothetical protein
MQTTETKKKSLKHKAEQDEYARDNQRIALKNRFQAIEAACSELFERPHHYFQHEGHKDAWFLCASALDNAAETANERHFELESLEYWECAISSLESLCCYTKPRVRRWFKKLGFKF